MCQCVLTKTSTHIIRTCTSTHTHVYAHARTTSSHKSRQNAQWPHATKQSKTQASIRYTTAMASSSHTYYHCTSISEMLTQGHATNSKCTTCTEINNFTTSTMGQAKCSSLVWCTGYHPSVLLECHSLYTENRHANMIAVTTPHSGLEDCNVFYGT